MSQSVCIRWSLPRLLALAAFLGSAGLFGYAAQPPKEDEDPKGKTTKKIVVEDEDTKGTVKKKIVVDDDGTTTKKVMESPSGTPPDVRLEELVRAADESRNAALRDLFTRYIIPFDRITEGSVAIRVKPIPIRKSEWAGHDSIQVTPLDNAGKPRDARGAKVADIKKVEIFETIIQEEAEKLQKQKMEGLTSTEQLAAAEKLLSAALRFHDYSRVARSEGGSPRNLRRGKGWDEIRDSLVGKLRGVQLELLRNLVAANDSARLRELTTRLISSYPKDVEVAQAVAVVQVVEAERLLKSGSDQDCIAARKMIDELERTFPGAGGEAARKIRTQLRDLALKALNRSREKMAVGDKRTARDELVRAEALDPDLDGIREMQRKLQIDYPILYVGVRQYPQNMSPITARLDSEKQAVELLFEGLLEEVPDESGAVRYRPGAALTMPVAVPGGREFLLRAFDRDAAGRPGFDSHDVVGTVNFLRSRPHTWAAYPLTWLAPDPPTPKDSGTVRVAFGLTPPDPRAALTFKLLPTRWMNENGRVVDDGRFAENPFGTGPFSLHSNPRPDGNNSPREMIFTNSPSYGRSSDRVGLPRLREIRLVEVNKIDPIKAFQEGKLHILPDIPTSEIDRYTDAKLKNKVDVVTAAVNRRVHILAVNLRRPYLQSKQLRQGISLAIDREDILRKEFREGKDVHKPMTGPFPPGSWPTARGTTGPAPLMNLDLAMVRLKAYLADQGARTTIELAYPDNDPQAEKACTEIKKQVEGLFKGEPPGSRKLSINLVKVPLVDLLVNVQDQHSSFDLAYVPFDYPDDWYPFALSAALDPSAAEKGGRNWFSFLDRNTNPDAADQELGRALTKLLNFRDFAGELVPQSAAVSKLFNDSLPFIPLWQLDRHMVVSKRVKVFVDDTAEPVNPRLLNPTILFQGVGRWRVE